MSIHSKQFYFLLPLRIREYSIFAQKFIQFIFCFPTIINFEPLQYSQCLVTVTIRTRNRSQKVLYTGDSVVDAKTAAAAAVDFAGVLTGTTSFREFEPFDHICIVSDLAELMNALTQEK